MTQTPVAPAGGRFAGARVHRVEDARLLTGSGTYVDDVVLPGMLHACFVRSPLARGRILAIDASAALAVPGVRHVFVAADVNPGMKEQWHTADGGPDAPETPRPPLAEDEVRFVGDCGRGRRRRRPLHRRGRRRPRRRGVRAASCARGLHAGRADRRAGAPEPRVERLRRDQRPARVGARRTCSRRLPTSRRQRSTSRRTPPSRWRPGASWSTTGVRATSSRSTRRRSPPTRCARSARACSACPSTASAW